MSKLRYTVKKITISIAFIVALSLISFMSLVRPVQAELVTHTFLEDWLDTKFELNVTVKGVWNLPETYDVTVTIKITDMGDNEYLWINDIKISISLFVEERVLVNKYLYSTSDTYSVTITLNSNTAFDLIKPGNTESYMLSVDIRGEVKDKNGYTWPTWTYESFNIDVYAPQSPVKIAIVDIPSKIIVNDTFPIQVSVTNEGEYSITDVEVGISELVGADIIGDKTFTIAKLEPKATENFTFQLKAKLSGETSTTVYVSYKSVNGYTVHYWEFPFCQKKIDITISKVPTTLTCMVSSEKVTEGDKITVSGKLEPPMKQFVTVTFTKPDGTTIDKTVLTNVDGSYTLDYTPDAVGSWSVRASWEGLLEFEGSKSDSVSFTVEEKKRCIIATATYGSELSPQVQFLREFRDNIVLKTFAGKNFMEVFNAWYYSFSPYVASIIASNDVLRNLMKIILYPLLQILHLASNTYFILSFYPEFAIVISGFIASSLICLVYFLPLPLLLCFIKKVKVPIISIKVSLLLLFVSIIGITASEIIEMPVLMMSSTALYVLTTISLTLILSIYYLRKIQDHT